MTKATKPATAPAPTEQGESKSPVVNDTSTLRDEFAMRVAAAIVSGIVQRGGTTAVASAYRDDQLMETAYYYADSAMRVRAAS